jgi:2-haloacid dehalogenase
MSSPRLSAVLLDVNETLFSLASLGDAFAQAGLDRGQVKLWFARVLRDGFAFATAGDFRRFGDVAQAALGGLQPEPLPPQAAARVMDAFHALAPHPDVPAGLEALSAAGLRLVTLTVGDTDLVRGLFARAGLARHIADYLSADVVRRWKPAPEPYEYALRTLALEPAAVALLAAHDWDIHGARRVGLRTGRVARIPASPLFDEADVVGADLPAVAHGLLERFVG